MDKISTRQQAVLDVLDEQIEELEEKLAKVQPFINELNRLRQTRRTLLSERGVTGGGGNGRVKLSMEEVITFLQAQENGATPAEIAEAMGVEGHIVRSHLSRGKDTRYALREGRWYLFEDDEPEEG